MRPDLSRAARLIVAPALLQRLRKALISGPSGAVAQLKLHFQQISADDIGLPGEQSHIPRPCLSQQFTIMNQVAVPGGDGSMRLSRFESGISLLEDLVITLPVVDELLHVEQ